MAAFYAAFSFALGCMDLLNARASETPLSCNSRIYSFMLVSFDAFISFWNSNVTLDFALRTREAGTLD